MAEILEFGKNARCARKEAEKDTVIRRRKIETLKKVFQCTRCMMKCAKCGTQIDSQGGQPARYATPYPFCQMCCEEYEEYRARMDGKEADPRYYWHNEAWMKAWETWIEHQKRMEHYRQSKEFLQLLGEAEELLRE